MQIRILFYILFKYMVYVYIIYKYYEFFLTNISWGGPTYFYVSFLFNSYIFLIYSDEG